MKALRLKTHHFHIKLAYQKPMFRRIKWWLQNGPITKNGVLSVTSLFLRKLCFSLRTAYKELICCTSKPNTHIYPFLSAGVSFDGAFSLWVSLTSDEYIKAITSKVSKTIGLLQKLNKPYYSGLLLLQFIIFEALIRSWWRNIW